MNVFAIFDEIPSLILQDIKETKRYGQTDGRSFVRSDGQRENSIPPANIVSNTESMDNEECDVHHAKKSV